MPPVLRRPGPDGKLSLMRCCLLTTLVLLGLTSASLATPLDDLYKVGPDSLKQPGVPTGKLAGPFKLESTRAFPATSRDYWVYVPEQYKESEPAALMVFQDGHAYFKPDGDWRIPTVFDNLIYRREMPVTIAVFINPGHTAQQPESSDKQWGDGVNNRGLEYNALDDKYATLICDELLPEVRKSWKFSERAEDHAIAGTSSGAIAAWTVAWHRPEVFTKVLSSIGSFTNIRGGHVWPEKIRSEDKRPIRIYLQDGLNDHRGYRGDPPAYKQDWDWHRQNVLMVDALTAKGYDVNYCWGIGTHSGKQAGAQVPEQLRWLWRDYPRTDVMDEPSRQPLGATTRVAGEAVDEKRLATTRP